MHDGPLSKTVGEAPQRSFRALRRTMLSSTRPAGRRWTCSAPKLPDWRLCLKALRVRKQARHLGASPSSTLSPCPRGVPPSRSSRRTLSILAFAAEGPLVRMLKVASEISPGMTGSLENGWGIPVASSANSFSDHGMPTCTFQAAPATPFSCPWQAAFLNPWGACALPGRVVPRVYWSTPARGSPCTRAPQAARPSCVGSGLRRRDVLPL